MIRNEAGPNQLAQSERGGARAACVAQVLASCDLVSLSRVTEGLTSPNLVSLTPVTEGLASQHLP